MTHHPVGSRRAVRGAWRFPVVTVLLALVVVGCATSGATGPAITPSTTATKASAAEPLLVGASVSLSGRYSREGATMRAGYESWARAANDGGGIDVGGTRRPIRLALYDDQSEPLIAAQMTERLVRQDGVSLLLGPFSSQMTTASATVAERLEAVTVAPDASAPALYARGLRMIVSILPTDDRYLYGILELARALSPQPRSLALFVPDDVFFVTAAEGLRDRARALGLDPVLVDRYPPDARDVSGSLDRIAALRPDLLLVGGAPERLALFLPQIRELRLAPPLRGFVPSQRFWDLAGVLGDQADGVVTLDWWSPGLATSGPVLGTAGEFAVTFERLHGYPPDARAAAAAAAGIVLQLGIERAGSADAVAVREALSQLDVQTFWGRLAWDPDGRNRAAGVPVLQFQGGHPLVVYPRELAQSALQYPSGDWPAAQRR